MALVLLNAQIAHRTRTIRIGSIDCDKFITKHRIHREIEIVHLRFDCSFGSEIQQGNPKQLITKQLLQKSSISMEFYLNFQLHISELPTKTPFVCVCIKEMWLMIQLLIEKLHENGDQLNTFWFYFSDALKQFRDRKGKCISMPSWPQMDEIITISFCTISDPYSKNNKLYTVGRESISIYPNDSLLFSIWLLNGVAVLNGFNVDGLYVGPTCSRVKEHADLLESLIRSFIASESQESNVRSYLLISNSLLTEW